MKLFTTVSHRPKGNALVERPNAFLRTALTALCNTDKTDWNEVVGLVSLTYRVCVHLALGETPFFLERGRDARMPQELLLPTSEMFTEPDDVQSCRTKMIQRLQQARK